MSAIVSYNSPAQKIVSTLKWLVVLMKAGVVSVNLLVARGIYLRVIAWPHSLLIGVDVAHLPNDL